MAGSSHTPLLCLLVMGFMVQSGHLAEQPEATKGAPVTTTTRAINQADGMTKGFALDSDNTNAATTTDAPTRTTETSEGKQTTTTVVSYSSMDDVKSTKATTTTVGKKTTVPSAFDTDSTTTSIRPKTTTARDKTETRAESTTTKKQKSFGDSEGGGSVGDSEKKSTTGRNQKTTTTTTTSSTEGINPIEKLVVDPNCICPATNFLGVDFAATSCQARQSGPCPTGKRSILLTCGPKAEWAWDSWDSRACRSTTIQHHGDLIANFSWFEYESEVKAIGTALKNFTHVTKDFYYLGRSDFVLLGQLLTDWSDVLVSNPFRVDAESEEFKSSVVVVDTVKNAAVTDVLCMSNALNRYDVIMKGDIDALTELLRIIGHVIGSLSQDKVFTVNTDAATTQAQGFNCLEIDRNSELSFPPPKDDDKVAREDPQPCPVAGYLKDLVRAGWLTKEEAEELLSSQRDSNNNENNPPLQKELDAVIAEANEDDSGLAEGSIRLGGDGLYEHSDCDEGIENGDPVFKFTSIVVSVIRDYDIFGGRTGTKLRDNPGTTAFVWSSVYSITFGNSDPWPYGPNLSQPVFMDLFPYNLSTIDAQSRTGLTPICSFWYVEGEEWRTDGCETISDNGVNITCACNHTTNFAVLMSADDSYLTSLQDDDCVSDCGGGSSIPDGEEHARALNVIMYIGFATSLVFYSLTLGTYLVHHNLLTKPKIFLCHICATLMLGETFFVLGIINRQDGGWDSDTACTAFGVLAQFTLLAAFFWTLVDALYIYDIFVNTMEAFTRKQPSVAKVTFGCYGSAALVVAITNGALTDPYQQRDGHCFLSSEDGGIYAFTVPVLLVIAINLVVFLRVIKVVTAAEVNNPAGDTEEERKRNAQKTRNKRTFRASMSFFFLLGIGWVFGIFALGAVSVAFQYVFSIMLILQGVCIFVFQCVLDQQVRSAWGFTSSTSSEGQMTPISFGSYSA